MLGQPDAMFRIGAESLRSGAQPRPRAAAAQPRLAGAGLPPAAARGRQVLHDVDHAACPTAAARTRPSSTACTTGYVHSRLDCDYARGLFTVVPQIFRLPAAHVVHEECESDGAPACVYHVTWDRRSRWRRHGRRRDSCRSTPSSPPCARSSRRCSSPPPTWSAATTSATVLQRITERAAGAVLAQGHLLVVDGSDGGAAAGPVLRRGARPAAEPGPARCSPATTWARPPSSSTSPPTAAGTAGSPRCTRRASAARPTRHRLLHAYARHAAAALDGVLALEASRRERAPHGGAARPGPPAVRRRRTRGRSAGWSARPSSRSSAARRRASGCGTARAGCCRARPPAGCPRRTTSWSWRPRWTRRRPPSWRIMLTDHAPDGHRRARHEPGAARPARRAAARARAGRAAGRGRRAARRGDRQLAPRARRRPAAQPEVVLRLQGVGDQAATALHNTRLLTTVRHQALHDDLTGLPNRVLFADRLEQALAACGRGTAPCGRRAVLRPGPLQAGQRRARPRRRRRAAAAGRPPAGRRRRASGASLGRLSGDEFAVLLPDVADLPAATAVARRVTEAFEHAFHVEGQELPVTLSVGVALHAGESGRGDQLLRAADAAMYVAKQRGRNQVASGAGPAPPRPRQDGGGVTERELRHALEHDELRLVFQPVLDVVTRPHRRRRGARALAAPAARPARARQLPAAVGGERARHRAGPLGAAHRVRGARAGAAPGPARRRQPVRPHAAGGGASSAGSATPCATAACRRPSSPSRSSRAAG